MDINPAWFALMGVVTIILSIGMYFRSNNLLYLILFGISIFITAGFMACVGGYLEKDECMNLSRSGHKTIYNGRCYVEIKSGLYQNIGGKYTHIYSEEDLIKN